MDIIDTILSLLAEGHSIDSIAEDFTKALNKAKKIQEETEKEKETARLEDAEDLIQTANYFFETYFPDTLRFDFTGEELVNAMEELAPDLRKFSKMIEALSETPKEETPKEETPDKKEKPATLSSTPDKKEKPITLSSTPISDPFSYFFKNFNL